MKLIDEYAFKVLIFMICLVLLLEGLIFGFMYYSSNEIYEKTLSDALERSKKKSTELAEHINIYSTNLLMNYITKLKLVAKHTLMFNGKINTNNEIIINKNSKIFLNKDLRKKILETNTNEINKQKIFHKIFNPNNQQFDYIGYYKEKYSNESDNNKLLKIFQKEHEELNYISYYNITGPTNLNNLDEDTLKKLNYLVPIFKSIFLQRFLSMRSFMDLIRIIILNEKELIVYPPEDRFKINLHFFHNLYPSSYCGVYEGMGFDYFSCAFNHIYNKLFEPGFTERFIMEVLEYQTLLAGICIKYSFYKEKPNGSILCLEVNLGTILETINLRDAKNFNFGVFNPIIIDINLPGFSYYLKDIYIIGNTNREAYNEFKEVFNSTESTPYDYVIDENDPVKILRYYSLYHFMYLETTKIIKLHPELNINITKLGEEYELIKNMTFEASRRKENNVSIFQFNKTTCRKQLISNDYECFVDEAELSVVPLVLKRNIINDDIVETNNISNVDHRLFIYSIIYYNPKTNNKDVKQILLIKLIRIISLYIFLIFIILIIFFMLLNIFSNYSFDYITDLNNSLNEITFNKNSNKTKLLKEKTEKKSNKEMMIINNIYNLLRKSLIIKEAFDNEIYLKKHLTEYYNTIQEIEDKNIKEICNSFLAINHYKNKLYSLAENELNSTINFLKQTEKKIKMGDLYEKLKDEIKRSSTVLYLNEFSNFQNVDENMMEIIYLNIYKQRFIYLYAMTKYQLACEINTHRDKKNKEKREKYFQESIKYFKECKDINNLLGINQIKIIYSLIMISKCHLYLKDYKNSVSYINEALSLFFNFSKTFNNYHSKYYNPRIMLFIDTNIFNHILLSFIKICISFNKPCASNYLIFKIFNNSPFLLNKIHYQAGMDLLNFLDKNRTKLNAYDKNFYKNQNLLKEYEKIKKCFEKNVSRLNDKNMSSDDNDKFTRSKNSNNNSNSNKNQTFRESNLTSMKNTKADLATHKISMYHNKNKKMNKNIVICMSEKILGIIDGQEFNYIIINYLQKYFTQDENDKFSFIQFATNGKKTFFFQPRPLNEFISKLQKSKYYNIETLNDSSNQKDKNKSNLFMALYDILYSIIKNYQTNELSDNIIMLFINSKDIRFGSVLDCMNIVHELNKNNSSVYFFCFDRMVNEDKVNNIQSFLNGLIEGYFFEIKDYEQIKEIFVYLSNSRYQSNLLKFNYECFDHFM